MRRVKVTLPATVTHLGAGVNTLTLAIGLHLAVEFTDREDEQLVVETVGEGAGQYATGLRHPVVIGMMRVFQHFERAPGGLTVRIDNAIPLASGLGAEAAFLIAGVVGANNLIGSPLKRDPLVRAAAAVCRRPDHAGSALLGGLTATHQPPGTPIEPDGLSMQFTQTRLPVTALELVVVLPDLPGFAAARPAIPGRVPIGDALANGGALALLIDALRRGDHTLLRAGLDERLIAPLRTAAIPGFEAVMEAGYGAGATGIALCGAGPALLAFTRRERDRQPIADAMTGAFAANGISARTWFAPIDTQGLVLSAAQSG